MKYYLYIYLGYLKKMQGNITIMKVHDQLVWSQLTYVSYSHFKMKNEILNL